MAIFGDTFGGTLQNSGKHIYKVTAQDDGEVKFDFSRSSGTSSKIEIELKDDLGNTVISKTVSNQAQFFTTLGKGEYTLTVWDGWISEYSTDTYSLKSSFKHEDDVIYDMGSNDARDNATPAQFGATIVGSLINGDKDFFIPKADAGGKLSFNFLHPNPGSEMASAPIFIRVQDPERNLHVQELLSVDGRFETTVASAGNYVIEISDALQGRTSDAGIYRLESAFSTRLHTTYDGAANNTSATALATTTNRPVVGALALKDTDFFKMRAEKGGQLNINFVHPDGFGSSADPIKLTVLDSSGAIVLDKSLIGSGMLSGQLGGAGDYYIKLAPAAWVYHNMRPYEFIPTVTNDQGDDLIAGSSAGDVFLATSGNDTIDGKGGLDLAVFSGNRTEFSLTTSAAGVVVGGASGRDVLINVERARFDDIDVEFSTTGAEADL